MPTFTRKPPKGLKVTKERGWETTIHIAAQGRHCQVKTMKKRAREKAPQEEPNSLCLITASFNKRRESTSLNWPLTSLHTFSMVHAHIYACLHTHTHTNKQFLIILKNQSRRVTTLCASTWKTQGRLLRTVLSRCRHSIRVRNTAVEKGCRMENLPLCSLCRFWGSGASRLGDR